MTNASTPDPNAVRIKRTIYAPAELVWEVLTTPAGLEDWCGGFETWVTELALRPGAQVRYVMTAAAPEQVRSSSTSACRSRTSCGGPAPKLHRRPGSPTSH